MGQAALGAAGIDRLRVEELAELVGVAVMEPVEIALKPFLKGVLARILYGLL